MLDYFRGDTLTDKEAQEYEEIDNIRVKGMHMAERGCRKYKMGNYDYSPEFRIASNIITMWTLVLRRLNGRKVGAKRILRQKKRAGYDANTNITQGEARSFLNDAYLEYKKGNSKRK